jgi:hypothetical protein
MALAIAARNADENRMIDAEDSLALTVSECPDSHHRAGRRRDPLSTIHHHPPVRLERRRFPA